MNVAALEESGEEPQPLTLEEARRQLISLRFSNGVQAQRVSVISFGFRRGMMSHEIPRQILELQRKNAQVEREVRRKCPCSATFTIWSWHFIILTSLFLFSLTLNTSLFYPIFLFLFHSHCVIRNAPRPCPHPELWMPQAAQERSRLSESVTQMRTMLQTSLQVIRS